MKRLACISPLLKALQSGINIYEPDLPEVPVLETETGEPAASDRNVRRLLNEGFTVLNLIAGPAGVLFQFNTGEEYLALGFRLGDTRKATALAKLMAAAGYGETDELSSFYSALPSDYYGPIPLEQLEEAE